MPLLVGTNNVVQGTQCLRAVVTIPANGSTAVTAASLGSLTSDQQDRCVGFAILGTLGDGTGGNRPAIVYGDSTGSVPGYTAAGSDYYKPCTKDHLNTYFKASAGSTIPNAVLEFYLLA